MNFFAILSVWLASALGVPYQWGGDNPIEGYDCSGFVMEYQRMFGVGPSVDSSAEQIYNWYAADAKNRVQDFYPGAGALIFYGTKNASGTRVKHVSHIGVMISDDQVAEAGGGSRNTLSARQAAAQNAFVRIRPYSYRKDVVFILKPKYPTWVQMPETPAKYASFPSGMTAQAERSNARGELLIPYYY